MQMLYFTVFILFSAVFFLLYGILTVVNTDKIKIEKRLSSITETYIIEDKLEDDSFAERILKPFYKNLSRALIKITPGHKIAMLSKRLEKAGLLKNRTVGNWLFTKNMAALILSLVIALMSFMAEPNVIKAVALALLIMVSVNVFFTFYLSRMIENRKKKILKELPYTLDLITVSVEAGLSFDGAIARVINNISGDLCDEFAKSLKETRMGIDRKTALRNMSDRCDVRQLSMLITSLIQADELGVSLSRVLRIESANLREYRKQVSREKAMKAPIKMLIPLVMFIFPTIFIIILGPAVINIVTIFAKK
jgi:tight adherence protein C